MSKTWRIFLLMLAGLMTAQAADTLEELSAQLQARGAFRSLLLQEKQIAGFKRPITASGYLLFDPVQGLIYTLERPVQARYRMMGERIDVQEANLAVKHLSKNDLPWLEAVSATFNGALGGDVKRLQQHFELSFTPGAHWQLQLKPKAVALKVAMQQVVVNGAEAIDSIDLMDRNGDHTLIHLQQAQALSPAEQSLLTDAW